MNPVTGTGCASVDIGVNANLEELLYADDLDVIDETEAKYYVAWK